MPPRIEGDILEQVRLICMSAGFEREFEMFAEEHIGPFTEAIECKSGDEEFSSREQGHEFYRVYQKYLAVFESKIEKHIEDYGDLKDFQEEARKALDAQASGDPNRFFLEALLSTTEYDVFCSMMFGEAKRLRFEAKSAKK
ncbi:hypothetical protein M885DRAFT_548224 [Pelagophyceae sp. CCMP2097]|nr:hypothetical protein M885DRAFT_548224 [Pelagophyceae sp. CCMP2097]|mmetsp:Transcript_11153/g.37167  ORF Transcript_11153/g.37167 Transcript_11153/m.37167 type:complete len:141 (-) Transcript_11153:84-506(-)|eukprot:CAMPEP_0184110792 /NCGR_PEP_ID=MMETSP0974-20121125/17584_1 /TAXON_ID=483370 /ORGANISM="non described non described, Strain CCMP2097" /LENGTH=140 /DNA_ID=CAMNT_0026413869 /DNA_START=65 /DNA_END=487 /DNA_ORIENTATION=+